MEAVHFGRRVKIGFLAIEPRNPMETFAVVLDGLFSDSGLLRALFCFYNG